MSDRSDALLQVRNLRKWYPVTKGLMGRVTGQVRAVDDLSFDLMRGETLGLVGESGCGKTTAARALLRLIEPSGGQALYRSEPGGEQVDLFRLDRRSLRSVRRELQIVFQDPFESLNPRMSVGEIVGEAMRVHGIARGAALEQRVVELLQRVGLQADARFRFPHEFSGGQRQRIGIARALALEPRLIVCDEAVSALDVSIQAQILNLLASLKRELGLSYLFIAHDLSVVRHVCDRVLVMYLGRIVEEGPTERVFTSPSHPYTQALLASAPMPDPRRRSSESGQANALRGEVPSALDPPQGCHFRTRCPLAEDRCRESYPSTFSVGDGHAAACHLLDSAGAEPGKSPSGSTT